MFEAVEYPGVFLSDSWHPVGGRFYCPVCISSTKPPAAVGWNTRSEVVQHLKTSHGWDDPAGADAFSSQELTRALIEWRKSTIDEADAFGSSLRLVRGVDDFLAECDVG